MDDKTPRRLAFYKRLDGYALPIVVSLQRCTLTTALKFLKRKTFDGYFEVGSTERCDEGFGVNLDADKSQPRFVNLKEPEPGSEQEGA